MKILRRRCIPTAVKCILMAALAAPFGLGAASAQVAQTAADQVSQFWALFSSLDGVPFLGDAKAPIVVWTGGEPIEWRLDDGQIFDVSATANGEAISLTFRAPDSERTTVYRSDGQQLVTETTIISPLLSTPIRYRVVYNRAS